MRNYRYIDSKETFELYKKYFKYTGKDPKAYPVSVCPRRSSDSDSTLQFGSLRHLHPYDLKLLKENPEKLKEQTLKWIYERIDNFSKIRKFIRESKEKIILMKHRKKNIINEISGKEIEQYQKRIMIKADKKALENVHPYYNNGGEFDGTLEISFPVQDILTILPFCSKGAQYILKRRLYMFFKENYE